jgi:transcriptional regulator with XRE-family HTH domain
MGHARRRPKRLAEKLLRIRYALDLSQSEMVKLLGIGLSAKHISRYERDKSEPAIEVLLAYARAVGVRLEQIVDDDLDLFADDRLDLPD